mgnify:CR=1 FL=1
MDPKKIARINELAKKKKNRGLTPEEAYKHFFMIDKQGLLFDDMEDLTPAQKPFAKKREDFADCGDMTSLLNVIKNSLNQQSWLVHQLMLEPSLKKWLKQCVKTLNAQLSSQFLTQLRN